MPDLPPDAAAVDLDTLAARAADGDERAASTLFADLSERLASVAKRRVREDEVDDCVQDALAIVAARYRTRGATVGILPWSFSVMRNVIGNLYQKRHRVDRQDTLPDDDASTALAAPAIDPLDEHSERWLRATVVRGLSKGMATFSMEMSRYARVPAKLAEEIINQRLGGFLNA